MTTETLRRAARIWDYLSAGRSEAPSDAIVVCCSYDLRVCDHACDLIDRGLSERLILSGKTGNWTRHLWDQPEATVFLERALARGVDPANIHTETESTNFGENIAFSRRLAENAETVTFVTKPNSVLRVRLTAAVQWPGIEARVTGPDLRFPEEVSAIVGIWGIINEMVGDIERILRYPALGFQAAQALPDDILDDWRYLVGQGFCWHLLADGKSAPQREGAGLP